MTVAKAVVPGSEAKALFLLQAVGDGGEESVWLVMLGGQEKDGEIRAYGFEAGANCELLVNGEGGADDGEVIGADQGPPEGVIGFQHRIGAVARLGEHIGARAESRDVPADNKNAVELRVVGAPNHQLIRRRTSKTVSSFSQPERNASTQVASSKGSASFPEKLYSAAKHNRFCWD